MPMEERNLRHRMKIYSNENENKFRRRRQKNSVEGGKGIPSKVKGKIRCRPEKDSTEGEHEIPLKTKKNATEGERRIAANTKENTVEDRKIIPSEAEKNPAANGKEIVPKAEEKYPSTSGSKSPLRVIKGSAKGGNDIRPLVYAVHLEYLYKSYSAHEARRKSLDLFSEESQIFSNFP